MARVPLGGGGCRCLLWGLGWAPGSWQCWAELESTTQAKARQLFEASKADQLVQSFAELDKKLLHMESQLQDVDPGGDLATVNSQLKKLQVWPD